jgi:cell fate regulator YaaT (PSP1 superfamily)
MTDNTNPQKNNDSYLSNDLIDENYEHLVHDKIIKELIRTNRSNCCDTCDENADSADGSAGYKSLNLVVAKCKGLLGIHFCKNCQNLDLDLNDNIVIKFNNEYEYATVIETGEIVNLRMDRSDCENNNGELPSIERIANERDIDRHLKNIEDAHDAKAVFIKMVSELSLEMKLVDIHYQFDRKKLFFFYTADGRVDFRELAKKLAANFKTRIELRQIGVRDEAKRIGGIATCGREYCCTSFMNNFKRITTDIAVENNISTSISKYTGPCGKLKCCLSFELD